MTTHPQDPAAVGPFAIQSRLGRGAMGTVYLARSPGGRLVAVKVVRDELAGDDGFRARFAREVEAVRKVSGAFTAAVVDADPNADRPWLATEYLPGPTLQKAVETGGPLSSDGVQSLAVGLAEALIAIHASGLVHRDLKPSNILLTGNGPRVIDFGIARALEEASLTATGLVIGTPGYLSPEQITGTAIGPASDVFALGAVLVFAASGRGPYATGTPASLLHRIVNEQPYVPHLPEPLNGIIRRCLTRDPALRPTPSEIIHQLTTPSAGRPTVQAVAPTQVLPPTAIGPPIVSGPPVVPATPRTGAVFATSRTRPMVFATISTLLWLAFIPRDQAVHPAVSTVSGLVSLTFLYFAVHQWILALRRKVVLRLSPQGLGVNRAAEVPWYGVTRLRVEGSAKRPWLIAWIEPPYQQQLPTARRHHGGLRVYPIAHGATHARRQTQANELRAALNWYAGRLHDNSP